MDRFPDNNTCLLEYRSVLPVVCRYAAITRKIPLTSLISMHTFLARCLRNSIQLVLAVCVIEPGSLMYLMTVFISRYDGECAPHVPNNRCGGCSHFECLWFAVSLFIRCPLLSFCKITLLLPHPTDAVTVPLANFARFQNCTFRENVVPEFGAAIGILSLNLFGFRELVKPIEIIDW